MGPGTLYGAIKRLAARNWIAEVEAPPASGERDRRRRFYTLTDEGRTAAKHEARRMEELLGIARAKTAEI